ncbi:MAG: anti-sigma factor [Proteobacteria bacterium]|nr:anti-sigma factor [Pseudomonadota bacterium]
MQLRERIKGEAKYHAAPPRLAARILASLPEDPAEIPRSGWRWNIAWVSSAVAALCVLALGLGMFLTLPNADDRLADDVVAGHVRALMVDHASDVASSDRHTVKPWFAGKLDFSPPVFDLTAQGFALVGGRLDYLDRQPVAALVYRHRQHLINLFVWPAAGDAPLRRIERQGFHLLHWAGGGMNYWAVSDLNADELMQFRLMLEKAAD